jgi:hypothetical protein
VAVYFFQVVLTKQGLGEDGILSVGALSVMAAAAPVAPDCSVLQSLIEFAVLEVLGGDDTVAARSVNDEIEGDLAGLCLGLPKCGIRALGDIVVLPFDFGDASLFKDFGARFPSMFEQEVIEFRTNLQLDLNRSRW